MKDKALEKKVISALSTDLKAKEVWSQPPGAMLIPYGGNRKSFYLLISLCLLQVSVTTDFVMVVCLSTLRILISSGIANGLRGVEIVPYLEGQGKMTRVFRLSVKTDAFNTALKLTKTDLLRENPDEGITCGWYVTKPKK